MTNPPVCYGPNSPFDDEERAAIQRIYASVCASAKPDAPDFALAIARQIACLEWLGQVLSEYPSPLGEQTLGSRSRGLQTLVDTLSATDPASFEFFLPTRALLGRALVMAECNFYRLLRHVCAEALDEAEGADLREQAAERLRICLYTKLVEEVLSAIASDPDLANDVRSKAVVALAQIWERRLTYRVRDFFPILEATWQARMRFTAVGGTLSGTQEMFDLFIAGGDPRFVDYFTRPHPSPDEIEAFREFLLGATTEELDRLAKEMAQNGNYAVRIHDRAVAGEHDAATIFYGFFRSRQLQATARRLAKVPGPQRTAEVYVMISYLEHMA